MMKIDECIDKLTNRHIAKLMRRISGDISGHTEAEVKRQMWFLTDDIKDKISEANTEATNS